MVHKKIRAYLAENGIYQTHIARQMGYHKIIINQMLTGKRKISVPEYFRICEILKVPVDTFYTPTTGTGND